MENKNLLDDIKFGDSGISLEDFVILTELEKQLADDAKHFKEFANQHYDEMMQVIKMLKKLLKGGGKKI